MQLTESLRDEMVYAGLSYVKVKVKKCNLEQAMKAKAKGSTL